MHNSGSTRARQVVLTAVAAWLFVCASASAQTQAPAAQPTVKARFEEAQQKDEKVRLLLTNFRDKTPAKELVAQVSTVMTSFEAVVRRYPTSGYADDALWHAGSLADAAYQRLNRGEDKEKALKLYRWLVSQYPQSTFVKQANRKIAALTKVPAPSTPAVAAAPARNLPAPVAAVPPPPPTPKPSPAVVATTTSTALAAAPSPLAPGAPVVPATPAPESPSVASIADPGATAPAAPSPDRATLTGIQRVVLPDSVRITLELDKEVAYREERLSGPSRLFFDLKNVQLTPALMDKVLSYNSGIINKIRVGRHPDNMVRVVLDLEDVKKYSVFTLYSPFRLVIDAERTVALTAAAAPPPPPPPVEIREQPIAAPTPEPAPPAAAPAVPSANVAGGFSMARQLGLSVSRIVIDPGHGGHDPGTMAKGLTEANLTLDVALRLEKLLQKELGVEVVLTRRTDVYIPLEERTAIANRHNADLFLSIHANSSRNASAKGIETYFLSFASSPEAEAIAARENATSGKEMHHLPDLLKAISLNNKLDESRDLANMVQESLVSTLKRTNKDVRSRGVKKAPFVVLIGAAMPSVLAEISFLTNRQELQLVKTAAYKDRIAQALYTAVLRYRKSLKGAVATTVER
jgi:N-acetylmuramoyl-L-alanine amidase